MAETIREKVLINDEYLKEYSLFPQNYDLTEIRNFIPIAERIHILPILGEPLYEELLNQVSENELTDENSTLLLKVYSVEGIAVVYESLPFIWSHLSKVGITLGKSDNSDSATSKDLNFILTRLDAQLENSKKYLKQWLDERSDTYPLYRTDTCSCNVQKKKKKKNLKKKKI